MEPINTSGGAATGQTDLTLMASQSDSAAIRAKAADIRRKLLDLADTERQLYNDLQSLRGGNAGRFRNLAIAGVVFVSLFMFGTNGIRSMSRKRGQY